MRRSYPNLLHGCRIPRIYLGCVILIEYFIFAWICKWTNAFDEQPLLFALGYGMLTVLFTCTNHGLNVRVHYEQELSIIVKNVIANVVTSVFIYGGDAEGRLTFSKLLGQMLLLTFCQVITTIIICAIAGRISKERYRGMRLYVCDNVNIDVHLVPDAEKYFISEITTEFLIEKVREATEVYLFDLNAKRRNDILKWCFKYNKPVFFSCKLSDIELQAATLTQDGEIPLFYRGSYQVGKFSLFVKRTFDIVFSGLLIVLCIPLFIGIAIAIKIEDKGEVFYRQKRCTKGMRVFRIIKFRSMIMGAEKHKGAQIAGRRDPRITRVGYFLRKYKLDELPQLINIFYGEMSFVGPRPERPELITKAVSEIPEFAFRTFVKAGLTGYAQVHGDYHTTFLDKLKWDNIYIENFSLLLDLKILVMTIPSIIKGSDDIS